MQFLITYPKVGIYHRTVSMRYMKKFVLFCVLEDIQDLQCNLQNNGNRDLQYWIDIYLLFVYEQDLYQYNRKADQYCFM